MALASFGVLPTGIPGNPVPFDMLVPKRDQNHLTNLVRKAEIGVPSYYNQHADPAEGVFGITRDWLSGAQDAWVRDFDWSDHQAKYNSYPNYRINVTTSDGQLFNLHFAGLFSQKADAKPIILMHGWPGAWTEFVPMLDLLAAKYTPQTLPYHVVVPSIPDYGLSTRADELETELKIEVAAEALNELMVNLGFNKYVAQGGDIGAFLAQTMCGLFEQCIGFHLNMYFMTEEQSAAVADIEITPEEQVQVDHAAEWVSFGTSYGNEHGTRPSTISLVLMTNPLAMLAWMGEKFIEWSDNRKPLSVDTILSFVSLYWFTDSYGRAMWAYRELMGEVGGTFPTLPLSLTKPFGFSSFAIEIAALPRSWAEYLFPNLVLYRSHDIGGHYAALEEPELFLEDVEEFMSLVTF
ncbi:putative epoxide hydrolase [Madurella mycetomatis]|uniref:Epoxide hydrolase n=1 Tax=Madurella mycetomatis TaxID=100816 RepID=A0A175W3D7_9PEZI|nr:putative epoxide hydrolase [Madurella mycetomatis]